MPTNVGSISYDLELDDSKFKGKAKSAAGELDGLAGSFKAAEAGSKIFAIGLGLAAAGVIAFGVKSVAAYQDAENAVAGLNQGLKNMGVNVDEVSAKLQAQATALQQVSKFADEEIISADAMLTTFRLSAESIEKINPALLDMAEGLRDVNGQTVGLDGAAQLIGKVMGNAEGGIEGMSSALRRQGVIMTEAQKQIFTTGSEVDRVNTLVEILSFNFEGRALAGARTFSGQMTILKNNINDFQELIGKAITEKLEPLIYAFGQWFTAQGGAQGLMDKFNNEIAPALQANLPIIIGFILGGLAPAFYALAGGIWATMAPLIPFIAAGIAIGFIVQQLIQAFGGWDQVMVALQPVIQLFKEAWAIILPQLQALWVQISTQLLPALQELWNQLAPLLVPVLQALALLLGVGLLGAIYLFIGAIRLSVETITFWVTLINNSINFIKKLFSDMPGAISSALAGLYDALVSPFKNAFDQIKRMADDVWNSIQRLNPLLRHSPSLVDNVVKGIGIIKDQYLSLGDLNFPQVNVAGVGSSEVINNAPGVAQTISINIDKVGGMGDIEAIGRELGFRAGLMPR